ncbi:MAG: sodium:proton antiporter, partial [Methylococcales bacterium]|nr:sodium:proton antiporter [Methylococcales bacterium]
MKKVLHLINSRHFFVLTLFALSPSLSFAQDTIVLTPLDLKHHFVGYLAVALTVIAYIIAMTEDAHGMKKSKPILLGSALVWFAIC